MQYPQRDIGVQTLIDGQRVAVRILGDVDGWILFPVSQRLDGNAVLVGS